jgi:hypothetical protein
MSERDPNYLRGEAKCERRHERDAASSGDGRTVAIHCRRAEQLTLAADHIEALERKVLSASAVHDCVAADMKIHDLEARVAELEGEHGAADCAETRELCRRLEADAELADWYFDQRRFSVMPWQDGGYLLFDRAPRYSHRIDPPGGGIAWGTWTDALRAAHAAREGE